MKEELLYALGSLAIKFIIDAGVRYSKSTKNTVDDFIFEGLDSIKKGIINLFKFKK